MLKVWTHESESATKMCHVGLAVQHRAHCVTFEVGALHFCCMPSSLTQGTFDPRVEPPRQHFLSGCVHIPPPSVELADPRTTTVAVTLTLTFCNPKHTELIGGAKRRGTKCFLRDDTSPASLYLCVSSCSSMFAVSYRQDLEDTKKKHTKNLTMPKD